MIYKIIFVTLLITVPLFLVKVVNEYSLSTCGEEVITSNSSDEKRLKIYNKCYKEKGTDK